MSAPPAEPAIRVESASKAYVLHRSPARRFLDLMFGWRGDAREFHALDDVSFTVARGETIGIIGRNGAGKSTLLAIVAGVLTPSAGRARVSGRVGALLELGAGFHFEATGRENIFLGASLLGLGDADIARRFDAIVEFADIGEHLDQPMRTYSSGMFVRLAFAVHTALEPDVLIVDEALAVGDAAFQAKCFRRLRELKSHGTAILMVTHDVQSVRLFCDRAIWLDRGRIRIQGAPAAVTAEYLRDLSGGERPAPAAAPAGSEPAIPAHGLFEAIDLSSGATPAHAVRWGQGGARLLSAAIASPDGPAPTVIEHGRRICITIVYRCDLDPPPAELSVGFTIVHRKSLDLLGEHTAGQRIRLDDQPSGTPVRVEFEFDNILAPDDYTLAAAVWRDIDGQPEYLDFVNGVLPFKVVSARPFYALAKPAVAIRVCR